MIFLIKMYYHSKISQYLPVVYYYFVSNKNDNSNECKQSYYPKEILLVLCKLYKICIYIERASNSLFLIWSIQGCVIVPAVLNPIFLRLKNVNNPVPWYRKSNLTSFKSIVSPKIIRTCFEQKHFSENFWTQIFASFKHFRCQNLQISVMYWKRVVFI